MTTTPNCAEDQPLDLTQTCAYKHHIARRIFETWCALQDRVRSVQTAQAELDAAMIRAAQERLREECAVFRYPLPF